MAVQKQDDQLEHTFSSYVRIRDAVLKTYQGRWMIGRSGERGSGISVLSARYDDDDDIFNAMEVSHHQVDNKKKPFVICLMIIVCKTSWNLRSQTNFHCIKYIKSNIYWFIIIIIIII